jgi:hypothetical protein
MIEQPTCRTQPEERNLLGDDVARTRNRTVNIR